MYSTLEGLLLLGRLGRVVLLLLELLLELRRDGRHGGGASLEALLRLALARESGILLRKRLGLRLGHASRLSLHREASILLLERLLPEAGGLRRKRALLLARLLASSHVVEGAAILLLLASWTLAVGAQEGVRVGIHVEGVERSSQTGLSRGVA